MCHILLLQSGNACRGIGVTTPHYSQHKNQPAKYIHIVHTELTRTPVLQTGSLSLSLSLSFCCQLELKHIHLTLALHPQSSLVRCQIPRIILRAVTWELLTLNACVTSELLVGAVPNPPDNPSCGHVGIGISAGALSLCYLAPI